MKDKRALKIAVISGSESDLPQMTDGLRALANQTEREVEVLGVYCRSVHRNPGDLIALLIELRRLGVDRLIVGAGWANHLSGMVNALLRNYLGDTRIHVFAVAFEDVENSRHTQAAVLSISEVPGHCMVFENYVGRDGFLSACVAAMWMEDEQLPQISIKTKPIANRTLAEAIAKAEEI